MSIYSRPAFLAEKTLAAKGITVTKNHLREIVAALCGFNTLAALHASPHFRPDTHSAGLLAVLDVPNARARCQQLAPGADPNRVVGALVHSLDDTAPPHVVIVENPSLATASLYRFARKLIMATPEMAGQEIDHDQRIRDLMAPSPGSPWPEGMDEKMAYLVAKVDDPVKLITGSVWNGLPKPLARLHGEYWPRDNEGGLVDVDITFNPLTPVLFAYEAHTVRFQPGAYSDDFPEFDGYVGD